MDDIFDDAEWLDDEEWTAQDQLDGICLELVRAVEKLLRDSDRDSALAIVDQLRTALDEDEEMVDGYGALSVFRVVTQWLLDAHRLGLSFDPVLDWFAEHVRSEGLEVEDLDVESLADEDLAKARMLAFTLEYLPGEEWAWDAALDHIGEDLNLILVSLAAGAVASAGGGDPLWLRQFDRELEAVS